ncbi:YpiF family protein [Domibacillus epiphyticus]|uniref:DUF2487 domain-containing protein n=1 Tax=Domibacillus epiphyticus TaxID=1714355 RepID=A0A1V2A4L5_9BACI|nr:YpiF family protein [Domibacillus epiphyticus]OMP65939.1 hypothetical protein BTO28_14960 [Domibacillus epiphyticus]
MNWNGKDTALFLQQKEYIDTAIVPLIPADFGPGMIHAAEQNEFIQLLVAFLEKQFKGRLLVTPANAYLPDRAEKVADAAQWADRLKETGFKHIFFFTSDSSWRQEEENVSGSVIWIPSVPLGDMEDSMKYSLIENQAKQIVNIIVQKWQANLS